MNEEVTINFKGQNGFTINNETDITTGKVIINNIEITSIEDWKKVVNSLVQLQQQNQKYKEVIDKVILIIKGVAYGGNEDYYIEKLKGILDILNEGKNE